MRQARSLRLLAPHLPVNPPMRNTMQTTQHTTGVPATPAPAIDPLYTARQLRERFAIPYCDDHLRRLVKAGKFPAPVKLSSRLNAYPDSAVPARLPAKGTYPMAA